MAAHQNPREKYLTDFEKELKNVGIVEPGEITRVKDEVSYFPHLTSFDKLTLARAFAIRRRLEDPDNPTPEEFKAEIPKFTKKQETKKSEKKAGKKSRKEYLNPEEDLLKQKIDVYRYLVYVIEQDKQERAERKGEQEAEREVESEAEEEQQPEERGEESETEVPPEEPPSPGSERSEEEVD